MKVKTIFLTLLILPVFTFGQVIPVKTELKNVKVYLSGAELFHAAKVKLEKGNSEILFENVASNFDVNSVSVTGKGNFLITSIGQQFDYLKNSVKPSEIKILEDSLEIINSEISKKLDSKNLLSTEADIIVKNGNLSGRQANVSVAEVQKYIDFVKVRMKVINTESFAISKEIQKLKQREEQIRKQLQELNNKYRQPVNQITVNVVANSAANAEFEISYLVYNASWTPEYDVRVQDVTKPIKMSYAARVIQNSGINWDNVKITLSSRNPNMSQTKPELNPWTIDFLRLSKKIDIGAPVPVEDAKQEFAVYNKVMQKTEIRGGRAETISNYTEVNEDMLSFEFESSIPYSIPADGKPHTVNLKDYELTSSFEFYAAPKLDRDAFLVGYITKWNDYNFLPGEASTYFQNSFIGKTYIDPNISKDTLTLSLGRDRGINVERKPLKDYTEDKFLSSDIERTFAYDIIVKNNKNKAVKVLVEEPLPISKNEDITVKVTELSGGIYNKETGKVKWNVSVDPGKSVTKRFVFSVRHPKDKQVVGL